MVAEVICFFSSISYKNKLVTVVKILSPEGVTIIGHYCMCIVMLYFLNVYLFFFLGE